jgi:thioredoxin reductase (NADPH)
MTEAVTPGGQASTTSMIENYLVFPSGINGSELATRAAVRARRFGDELLLARQLVDILADGPRSQVTGSSTFSSAWFRRRRPAGNHQDPVTTVHL